MAVAQLGRELLSGDELLEALEELRNEVTGSKPFSSRERGPAETKEQIAAKKRLSHVGGDTNHRFNGERYLNCQDKTVRREQLRVLIDEGGQSTVGGKLPSHPMLSKWHSYEFGVTEEEINRLEKEDAPAARLITHGWWYFFHRTAPWQVAMSSSLPGEGRNRLPGAKEHFLRKLDETRESYMAMGIKNIERALTLMLEHSPIGADAEHSEFGANVTRQLVNTPELQGEMRKAFTLRLHMMSETQSLQVSRKL